MSWEGLLRAGVDLAPSPSEQSRFGVTVDRLTVGEASQPGPERSEAVAERLDRSEADVVVVRLPADAAELSGVLACGPRTCLPAGTLVYWERPVLVADAEDVAPAADGTGDLRVLGVADLDPAAAADLPRTVTAVVEASFAGYGNHYSVDPLMPDDLALAGYVEWATRSVQSDPGSVLLLRAPDGVIGLATTSRGADGPEDGPQHLEVLLAGLLPRAQGRGRYGHLLRGVVARAARDGLDRVVISTQAHNSRVQRAWARAGFVPYAAYETVHCVRAGLLPARG